MRYGHVRGNYLSTFWWNAHTQKCEKYRANSLETIRHGLKRHILASGSKLDITDKANEGFVKSQKAFNLAMEDLKHIGKGHINHRKEIVLKGNFIYKID